MFWIKFVVAGFALIFLLKLIKPEVVLTTLTRTKAIYLCAAILLLIPNLGVQWLKWHYLLSRLHPNISRSSSIKSLLIGFPLGMMTPGRLGEVGRGLYLQQLPQKNTLTLAVVDKASNMLTSLAIGLTAILFSQQASVIGRGKILAAAAFLVIGIAWAALRAPSSPARRLTGGQCLIIVSYSVLFYFVYLGQLLILIFSFEKFDLLEGAAAAATTFFVKTILPISFGDLGIREGAAVMFFNGIGVSSAAAFNASFLLFIINVAAPTLLGLFFLFEKRMSGARN